MYRDRIPAGRSHGLTSSPSLGKGRVPGDDKLANSPPSVSRGVLTGGQAGPSLVKKCSNKWYKTCPSLVTGPTFKSSVTGRTYEVCSPCGPLGCQSRKVVYLITCKRCDVQYVGETSQMLRSRMNDNRTSTKGFKLLYIPLEEQYI